MDRYDQTLEFLFNRLQAFHRIGAAAYKPGLHTTEALSEAFGSPHKRLKVVHVGGTNGKGSTSHLIASVLQSAGYKVGLYTSPHLLDFNERIRVNGEPITHEEVVDFVDRFRLLDSAKCDPSFFELATVMAFEHFARHKVDVAVVEVGLGGRLDSTNIVSPLLSVITNISLDHTGILGDTVAAIAAEKAGIIKNGVPCVIGESDGEGVRNVFDARAKEMRSDIDFADDEPLYSSAALKPDGITYAGTPWGDIFCELAGDCQVKNANTVLHSLKRLATLGYRFDAADVKRGFASVCKLSGLMGRWMKVSDAPRTVCDTGHNPGAWQYLGPRLSAVSRHKHIVLGFVGDKDLEHIVPYLPADADYYFVQPSTPRAAMAGAVAEVAKKVGIEGRVFNADVLGEGTVLRGYKAALGAASPDDFIYVGGSTFVVADFLEALKP